MNDVPWLDEQEMQIWRGFIDAANRVTTSLDASLKERSGMTLDDYEVLVHLSETPERRLRMSELSDRLVHSRARLTQRIARLEDRGWVVRERCPDDGRGVFAVLTPDGHAAIAEAAPGHLRDVRELIIDLIGPGERACVADVLQRVADYARDRTEPS